MPFQSTCTWSEWPWLLVPGHLESCRPCSAVPWAGTRSNKMPFLPAKDMISSSFLHPSSNSCRSWEEKQRSWIPNPEFRLASSRHGWGQDGDIRSPEEIAADDCQKMAFPPPLRLKSCSFTLRWFCHMLLAASTVFREWEGDWFWCGGFGAGTGLPANVAPTFKKLTPGLVRGGRRPSPISWLGRQEERYSFLNEEACDII